MTDKRIADLEVIVENHLKEHTLFELALAENTHLTKQIAKNTFELVMLVKGAKGMRTFILWIAPVVAVLAAAWAWIRSH